MKNFVFVISLLSMAACLGSGCSVPRKQFKVTSYPPGATIFLDGEQRGQTDMEKLIVEFPKPYRTIRLEKEGFQTTGDVLEETSRDHLAYNLQEAPNNQKILSTLIEIHKSLDQINVSLEKSNSTEKNK